MTICDTFIDNHLTFALSSKQVLLMISVMSRVLEAIKRRVSDEVATGVFCKNRNYVSETQQKSDLMFKIYRKCLFKLHSRE